MSNPDEMAKLLQSKLTTDQFAELFEMIDFDPEELADEIYQLIDPDNTDVFEGN